MKKGILAICIASAILAGCIDKKLSPEEIALVSDLQAQLEITQKEISEAAAQNEFYSGGLIKGLIGVRIEVLKTNEALIQQRIHAIEGRAPVETKIAINNADPALAEELAQELADAQAELLVAETEAAMYSGGLIGAMKASAVATKQNTIALLEQRRLAAKYGLMLPASETSSAEPLTAASIEPTTLPAPRGLAPPADGPFGLAKGLTLDDIQAMTGASLSVVDADQNLYSSTMAPKSNSAFERYVMVISPVVGLCQIRAIGKDITVNSFGSQLRSEYAGLQSSLTNIYGPPETLDTLIPGSIWKDPDDWMMGL